MLVNPYRVQLTALEGSRLIQDERVDQLIGLQVPNGDRRRTWTIQSFLLPTQRALGGVRAKLQDQKGFISFINQRDLEVSLGLAAPGENCPWLGSDYVGPKDDEWIGLCADEDDLVDDLYERELFIRQSYPIIPEGTSFTRQVHLEHGVDVEETYVLLWDIDPVSGLCPDPRFCSVLARWQRVERVPARWALF
jgi:hypothetical protein